LSLTFCSKTLVLLPVVKEEGKTSCCHLSHDAACTEPKCRVLLLFRIALSRFLGGPGNINKGNAQNLMVNDIMTGAMHSTTKKRKVDKHKWLSQEVDHKKLTSALAKNFVPSCPVA